MRSTYLPFALPDIDEQEVAAVSECLLSGWLTTGPRAKTFEHQFAQSIGAKHGIAVNSATAAMHLVLEAIGLQRGDEVITTPYTFAATAEVVRYFDAKPVFVDVCPQCFNILPEQVEHAITPRTRAIMPVHIAGLPAELDAIYDIACRHNLTVIEDAAHAFPCHYKGRAIGASLEAATPRRAVCFSFYATKTITTGEGGMICTDDEEIANRCRIMALHGISRDAWKRYTAEGSWYYEVIAPGYKYNLTDMAASIGLVQLTKGERMWRRRAEIAARYTNAFAPHVELQTPVERADCQHAWHLYMLRLNLDRLCLSRAQFIQELKQRNIGTSVHFIPLHQQPYYRDLYGLQPQDLPNAHHAYERVVSLPIYSKMTDDDVQDVIDAVLDTIGAYRQDARQDAGDGQASDDNNKTIGGCNCGLVRVDRALASIPVDRRADQVV